jgi:hypothetical protein
LTSFPLPFLDLPLMSAAIVLFVTIKHSTWPEVAEERLQI